MSDAELTPTQRTMAAIREEWEAPLKQRIEELYAENKGLALRLDIAERRNKDMKGERDSWHVLSHELEAKLKSCESRLGRAEKLLSDTRNDLRQQWAFPFNVAQIEAYFADLARDVERQWGVGCMRCGREVKPGSPFCEQCESAGRARGCPTIGCAMPEGHEEPCHLKPPSE